MTNKKIIPLKMGKQPFFWRQAVTESPHRGWTIRNILLYPLIKYRYRFKKHESFLCDVLIIGSNPILNTLLLKKLAQLSQDKQTKLKVGILKVSDADYWAYHQFKKPAFLGLLSEHFKFDIPDINSFMKEIVSSANWNYIEPVFMNNDDLNIQYLKKDIYTNGFICHLVKKDNKKHELFSHQLPVVNTQENRLKEKLWYNFAKEFFTSVDSYREIQWSKPVHQTQDNLEKSHILLCRNVFLSSLPNDWLNIKTDRNEEYTFFKHDFIKESVGSAFKIANNFTQLEAQVLEDIKFVENLTINLDLTNLAYSQ